MFQMGSYKVADIFADGAGRLFNLTQDLALVEALGEFSANIENLKQAGLDGKGIVSPLLDILRDPTNPDITAAFTAAGLAYLPGKLAPLQKFADFIEAHNIGVLLEPIGFYADAAKGASARWPIVNANVGGQIGSVGLALSGSFALEFGVGRNLWEYSDELGNPQLRLAATGKLKAAAGLAIPFRAGKLGMSAKADGETTLAWHFAPIGEPLGAMVAALVAKRLNDLPNPFDLAEVSRAFDRGDLVAVQAKPAGSTELSVSVVIGLEEELAKGVTLSAGMTVDALVSVATSYELSLFKLPRQPGQSHPIACRISRHRLDEAQFAVGVGVELDISGLTNRVRSVLVKKAGLMSDTLQDIRPYLSPGTWLRENAANALAAAAGALVGNTELKAALQQDLRASFAIGKAGGLQAFLEKELADLLDRGGRVLTDTTDKAVGQLLTRLPAPLAAIAGNAAAKAALKNELGELIAKVRGKFETEAKKLGDSAFADLTSLLKQFAIGVTNAGAKADNALKGVRELVDKFEGLTARIVAELENPLRSRIKLRIASEESRWDGKGLQLSGVFTNAGPQTADLYRRIIHGDWGGLADLMSAGGAPSFNLDEDSRISITAGGRRAKAVEFVAFGFGPQVSGETLFSAVISVDPFGNVVLETEAEANERISSLGETMQLNFVNSWAVRAATRTADASAITITRADMGFAIDYSDRKLKRGELDAFVASMEDLLSTGARKSANAVFQNLASLGSKSTFNGAVSARMTFEQAKLLHLAHLGWRMGNGDTVTRQKIVAIALEEIRRAHPNRRFKQALAIAADVAKLEADSASIWMAFCTREKLTTRRKLEAWTQGKGTEYFVSVVDNDIDAAQFRDAGSLMMLALQVPDILTELAHISRMKPAVSPDHREWGVEDYRNAQKRIATIAEDWMKVSTEWIFFVDPAVSGRAMAFLRTIRRIVVDIDGPKSSEQDTVELTLMKKATPDNPDAAEQVAVIA